MWILESLEPPDRAQFDLLIESKDSLKIRQQVEHAFRGKGVHYQDIKKLSKIQASRRTRCVGRVANQEVQDGSNVKRIGVVVLLLPRLR